MSLFTKRSILACSIILLFARPNSYAQTTSLDSNDKALASVYAKIFPFYYGDRDSLDYYSELFSTKFTALINDNPATLNYKFQSLKDSNACSILTSTDGLFRIYSWNTWLGGTSLHYKNIFQFKSGNKVYSTDLNRNEDDFGTYFTNIFTLETTGRKYYLLTNIGKISSKDWYETIGIYTISNDTLNDKVKLIKTPGGLNNSISFEYDFFSLADRPERPIRLIKYDANKKIISIPIVLEDGKVTDRYILYQFNGIYFEKVKAGKKY